MVPALDLGDELNLCVGFEGVVVGRDDSVVVVVDVKQYSVDEVAQIGQQFIVIFVHEVFPRELGVAFFGSIHQKIIPPNFCRNLILKFYGVSAEHSCSVPLGKLAALVVEVLSGGDMVQ